MFSILGSALDGMLGFWGGLLGFFFVLICLMLIGIVLLQKGKGGGLSSAFGGGGSGSAFGTRTGDVMTWVTIVVTGLFLLLAIGTAKAFRPDAVAIEDPKIVVDAKPVAKDDTYRVTVSAEKGSKIFYTLDGTDPVVDNSDEYTGSLKIQQGQTLKIVAFHRSRKPDTSKIISKEFAFISTNPADKKADAKPADKKADAKPADKKADAKPADKKADAKPADKKTEAPKKKAA